RDAIKAASANVATAHPVTSVPSADPKSVTSAEASAAPSSLPLDTSVPRSTEQSTAAPSTETISGVDINPASDPAFSAESSVSAEHGKDRETDVSMPSAVPVSALVPVNKVPFVALFDQPALQADELPAVAAVDESLLHVPAIAAIDEPVATESSTAAAMDVSD